MSEEITQLENVIANAVGKQGKPVFGMIAGSRAFNLNVATSDTDYYGVYVGNIEHIIGLSFPPESIDRHNPDIQIYEIQKLCHLLLKGNPKVIEPLFTDHLCFHTPIWKDLQQVRRCVISQVVVDQYVGFGLNKVSDWRKGKGTDTKNFYQCIRLLNEAKRMTEGKEPKVWMEGEDREYLLSIRRGEQDPEKLLKEVDELHKQVENQKLSLPKEADPKPLNDWLVRTRLEEMKKWLENDPNNKEKESLLSNLFNPIKDTNMELLRMAEELMNKYEVKGRIISVVKVKSIDCYDHSNHSNDDTITRDCYIGVFSSSIDYVLSFYPNPITRIDNDGIESSNKLISTEGLLLIESSYAVDMISSGNHRILDSLFEDDHSLCYQSESWLQLKNIRNQFIAQNVIMHLTGVAESKIKAGKSSTTNATPDDMNKVMYQITRLLYLSCNLLNQHGYMIDNDQMNNLYQIRGGKIDGMKIINELKENVESLKVKSLSVLQKKVDKLPLSTWITNIRKASYYEYQL